MVVASVLQIAWRTLVFGDAFLLRRCTEWHAMDVLRDVSAIHMSFITVLLILGHMTKFVEPFVVTVVPDGPCVIYVASSIALSSTVPAARQSVASSSISVSAATGEELAGSGLVFMATGVSYVSDFSCALFGFERNAVGSCLQHCSSDVAHRPMSVRTFAPRTPSQRDFRVGVICGSPYVTLGSVSSAAVPADAKGGAGCPPANVDGLAASIGGGANKVWRRPGADLGDLRFQFPRCSSEAHLESQAFSVLLVVVSSPFCVWLHRLCNH